MCLTFTQSNDCEELIELTPEYDVRRKFPTPAYLMFGRADDDNIREVRIFHGHVMVGFMEVVVGKHEKSYRAPVYGHRLWLSENWDRSEAMMTTVREAMLQCGFSEGQWKAVRDGDWPDGATQDAAESERGTATFKRKAGRTYVKAA